MQSKLRHQLIVYPIRFQALTAYKLFFITLSMSFYLFSFCLPSLYSDLRHAKNLKTFSIIVTFILEFNRYTTLHVSMSFCLRERARVWMRMSASAQDNDSRTIICCLHSCPVFKVFLYQYKTKFLRIYQVTVFCKTKKGKTSNRIISLYIKVSRAMSGHVTYTNIKPVNRSQ